MKKIFKNAVLATAAVVAFSASAQAGTLSLFGQSVEVIASNSILKEPEVIDLKIQGIPLKTTILTTMGEQVYRIDAVADYSDVANGAKRCSMVANNLEAGYAEQGERISQEMVTLSDNGEGVTFETVGEANVVIFKDDQDATLRIENNCQTSGKLALSLESASEFFIFPQFGDIKMEEAFLEGIDLDAEPPVL